jgi:hypothetical protein
VTTEDPAHHPRSDPRAQRHRRSSHPRRMNHGRPRSYPHRRRTDQPHRQRSATRKRKHPSLELRRPPGRDAMRSRRPIDQPSFTFGALARDPHRPSDMCDRHALGSDPLHQQTTTMERQTSVPVRHEDLRVVETAIPTAAEVFASGQLPGHTNVMAGYTENVSGPGLVLHGCSANPASASCHHHPRSCWPPKRQCTTAGSYVAPGESTHDRPGPLIERRHSDPSEKPATVNRGSIASGARSSLPGDATSRVDLTAACDRTVNVAAKAAVRKSRERAFRDHRCRHEICRPSLGAQ